MDPRLGAEPLAHDQHHAEPAWPPPLLPPLPEAASAAPPGRSLAAIVAGLENGVIGATWGEHEARIVILEGRPHDAVAVSVGQITMRGGDVLDELSALPATELKVRPTSQRLALAMATSWTAPQVVDVQVCWLDSAQIVTQLNRPGRAGAILVAAPTELGVAFIDQDGLVCAYSDRHPKPGELEVLTHLLAEPEARLAARLKDLTRRPPAQEPVHLLPAWEAPNMPERPSLEQQRHQILAMVHDKLGVHAEPVALRFLTAPPTHDGLLAACEEVRKLRPRLVSPATLAWIADQAQAVLQPR
jgi:hypothetical protein